MYTQIIRKLENESVPILVLCAAILAFSAALRYVAEPEIVAIHDRVTQLKAYRSLISSENGYQSLKVEIASKNQLLHKKIDQLSGGSAAKDLSGILEVLIGKAKILDIGFTKMQPQTESSTPDYTICPVLLEMNTTYAALGQFIAALESMPHLMKVDRLALEAKPTGQLDVKLLVTCLVPIKGQL